MPAQADPFGLSRFLEAQAGSYGNALDELRAGRKQSHWIWYVFPQLSGLGRSSASERFGLSGVAEAAAYLAHPVLGARLREAVEAMLTHKSVPAAHILGALDAMKFRSCLTLFNLAAPTEALFSEALQRFFADQPDQGTLQLVSRRSGA
ncbi:DUF1810 domain-containing protein [Luteimonas sp. 50]|uniref:DUF1810 domain-containing protein n=1 Tax=Cognatiluteimonas sedimenti TaxID=2927791 RepID=A0ABT0A6L6_9GAMM|nr:DUF1810 domain-containing protein [Lysobacter sedimenti]MCJ0826638.1 DUF1810 domain-containing protein [Lysobacter sedimenti]